MKKEKVFYSLNQVYIIEENQLLLKMEKIFFNKDILKSLIFLKDSEIAILKVFQRKINQKLKEDLQEEKVN